MSTNAPIPPSRLRHLSNAACDAALAGATGYDHSAAGNWNTGIINAVLAALIAESSGTATGAAAAVQTPRYKFVVHSTVIQHLSESSGGSGGGSGSGEEAGSSSGSSKVVGRRGMHSASGAYWNNERDGMWSHKWEGGEGRGVDVVVAVMWIAL